MNTTSSAPSASSSPPSQPSRPSAIGGVGLGHRRASADDLDGGERDRVSTAADRGRRWRQGHRRRVRATTAGEAYEVEVREADGTEVDVTLDKDLNVLRQDTDDRRRPRTTGTHDATTTSTTGTTSTTDDANDTRTPTTAPERHRAHLGREGRPDAVGGGTVVDVDASDDRGEAYEVEVRKANGTEWDVTLDSGFKVLRKVAEN